MNGLELVTIADDLLSSAVAVLPNPPTRQFIAHGAWALDCECVAVEILDAAVSEIDPAQCAGIDTITLGVSIVRCYIATTSDQPTPAASDINADSYTLAYDLGQLIGGLGDRWAAGTLFPSLPDLSCGQVQFPGVLPKGPEGGYAGWQVNVSVKP